MPDNNDNPLSRLLEALTVESNSPSMIDLLESAQQGFTEGANHFVEHSAEKLQPADIKDQLRTYPVAQILISIVRYHELNKSTEVIRNIVLPLLDSLDQKTHSEQEPKVQTTFH